MKLKVLVGSGDRVMGLTLPGVGLVLDTWLGPAPPCTAAGFSYNERERKESDRRHQWPICAQSL